MLKKLPQSGRTIEPDPKKHLSLDRVCLIKSIILTTEDVKPSALC
jgi:hypothetical protein